jgi:hypothetical protein
MTLKRRLLIVLFVAVLVLCVQDVIEHCAALYLAAHLEGRP